MSHKKLNSKLKYLFACKFLSFLSYSKLLSLLYEISIDDFRKKSISDFKLNLTPISLVHLKKNIYSKKNETLFRKPHTI